MILLKMLIFQTVHVRMTTAWWDILHQEYTFGDGIGEKVELPLTTIYIYIYKDDESLV